MTIEVEKVNEVEEKSMTSMSVITFFEKEAWLVKIVKVSTTKCSAYRTQRLSKARVILNKRQPKKRNQPNKVARDTHVYVHFHIT